MTKTKTCCKKTTKEIKEYLPKEELINEKYKKIKAISDPTRIKILYLLKEGELCVCEILDEINKSQSTISHHLNILKNENIILQRKQGTWNYYKLKNPKIIEILEEITK